MKYIVAPGVCFSNRGVNYEAGAEITADVFDPQSAFEMFVKQGKIIPVDGGGQTKTAKTSEQSGVSSKANILQKLISPLQKWRK